MPKPNTKNQFEIVSSEQEGVFVITMTGELTFGASSAALADKFRKIPANSNIALEISGVTEIDSTGLQVLTSAVTTRPGHFNVVAFPGSVAANVLEECNLDIALSMKPNVDEAVFSLVCQQ